MPRTGLSQQELRDATLAAAEATIRRHGIARTRLVDVARQVGVSHAMLYRLFPDRAALVDAVSARWLDRIDSELATIVAGAGAPELRLRDWFVTLHRLKRAKVSADPELYAAFEDAAERTRPVVAAHLATATAQLEALVDAAMTSGAIARADASATARLLFEATLAFHHPKLVLARVAEDREPALRRLLDVLLTGLARGA